MAEVKVPELAESITEGTIAQWLKKPGEYVEKGESICELETDKVNVEIMAEESGVLQQILAREGDTVAVGQAIAVIGEGQADQPAAQEAASKATPEAAQEAGAAAVSTEEKQEQPVAAGTHPAQRPVASPAARKIAREKGIDLTQVPTVDPLGRVRKQDVESFAQQQSRPQAAPAAPVPQPQQPAPSVAKQDDGKPVVREKMSRRRQTIAKRLLEVTQSTAMLTTFNEIDMSAVIALRKRKKEKFFEEHDVRLGFMSFFVKAAVAALKKYPYVNAEIQGDEIILKKYYDIGVAVSTDEGLVVPVVRDCDRKNFAEIERDIAELAEKARNNKLSLSDLQGGTFTITNGGVFGSLFSTPLLNGPQVGILGMHAIKLRPVAIDEERIENRPMMYVALSYDHRIIDGKEAVGFLKTIKDLIENPEDLLLES
ncbi:2-oxoglutarate dehydrogenase complex dihydrolipoyllysine-residue succinyltransferase [Parageobacillus thermoglucosidasius]|uniref:Dihydrolipoyllysine-residue succinyltransferase component of 2-oxoglutarate dehydrogenase complex n=1 Tax=Parageobacillus thermoglucosidasius TaxID=1426 RepID=A0AB38R462_PARTM|nr:2-oxoglutarate dehydrogenase complex dihydrolipoyllysine-residue succinyltransferase [Parageobacillus thermoglucosidasius]REK54868.1 MAG: dihydrolipoamide succinyltransferase [Geobacillus sp.]UOE77256.1 2-oxoglutarate dehydrogenase complex dihydrolipoyllysine-residue succinyltransferase [Parageobacillus thermoglucosidasius]BDG33028.1 dihydrolipoyllysine-residue succinyltransferase component of 2-oxoglutarate dehydrogenase complex [Parageobacillus thermoglucosidasius]GCD83535.1 dihydrolipoyll